MEVHFRTLLCWMFCLALLGLGGFGLASAQPASSPEPAWSSLSATQRQMLEPLAQDWPVLGASSQQKWVQLADRMSAMSPQERERISQRMREWARLPPSERARARAKFQQAQGLKDSEQRKAQWDAYRALPEQTRAALNQRAASAAAAPPPIKLRPSVVAPSRAPAQVASAGAESPGPTPNRAAAPTPVSPALKKAQIGATTTLASKVAIPPPFQRSGLPKIAGSADFVDERTLLPKPDAAAIARSQSRPAVPPAASSPSSTASSVTAP